MNNDHHGEPDSANPFRKQSAIHHYPNQQQPSKAMNLRIALLMMQKNEGTPLEPWIRYHTEVTANTSIYIFDNGSSNPDVVNTLAEAERTGVHIIRYFNSPDDYLNSGRIFSQFIQEPDQHNPHDFYFPMDCDEFLACQTPAGLSCRPEDPPQALPPAPPTHSPKTGTPFRGERDVQKEPRRILSNPQDQLSLRS